MGRFLSVARSGTPTMGLCMAAVLLGLAGCSEPPDSGPAAIAAACGDVSDAAAITSMACFARLDADGDGALSQDEAALLPALAGRLAELDSDRSGQLSPAELKAAFGASPAAKAGTLGY